MHVRVSRNQGCRGRRDNASAQDERHDGAEILEKMRTARALTQNERGQDGLSSVAQELNRPCGSGHAVLGVGKRMAHEGRR